MTHSETCICHLCLPGKVAVSDRRKGETYSPDGIYFRKIMGNKYLAIREERKQK